MERERRGKWGIHAKDQEKNSLTQKNNPYIIRKRAQTGSVFVRKNTLNQAQPQTISQEVKRNANI